MGSMKTLNSEDSPRPADHSENIRAQLSDLIEHLRTDVERIVEPRFQALLETSAEVLQGVRSAFERYDQHRERAAREVAARGASRSSRRASPEAEVAPVVEMYGKDTPEAEPSGAPAATPDPDEIAARSAQQKKAARAPQRPRTPAAPKSTLVTGKPLWKKPHSS
jgi:hypothetical protein